MTDLPPQRTGPPDQPVRPPAPPYPSDPTTATRHLCAGAYLDDDFRDACLQEVYYQPKRMVAPSYGFDLLPVIGHALKARDMAVWRDAAIVTTLLVGACTVLPLALAAMGLALLWITSSTWRFVRDTRGGLRTGEPASSGTTSMRLVLLLLGWAGTAIFVLPLALMSFSTLLAPVAIGSSRGGTTGDAELTVSFMFGLLLLALPSIFAMWRHQKLDALAPGRHPAWPSPTPRLTEIYNQSRGNTVVYSGYTPFVGSGVLIGSSSFAVRLVRPAHGPMLSKQPTDHSDNRPSERELEFAQPPFEAQEIITYVRDGLGRIASAREAEAQIPGLTIEDRVFLSGSEVSHLSSHTPPDVMAGVVRHPTTPARHYLACQVVSWGGELVTTVYVHIAVQGRSLYLELTSTALAPCDRRYRIVDSVERLGTRGWLRTLRDSLLDTPSTIVKAPVRLTRSILELVSTPGALGTASLVPGYDYGARVAVRQLGSRDELRNFTQTKDIVKFQRLIERRVVASVLDFLDLKGVDTTEYRARAASVLNVGIGNFGSGDMTFNESVTGQNLPPQTPPS
ncbi:hypothetical protein [Polymorphospora rubra]|uniref:Uncharacterized protein n=1 Tax=Polymorphospora rubra TaxID=338584 RepID=A0A810N8M7_9ACTN|nr:hypothetical protein [Polymorphospora rubra]BCJ68138.1 hypothetical protein Prubr_51590 [Polymorphospora rubra]